jgi:hypothetical protein
MHLFNWKARRAGARITVTGTDSGGDRAKITGVSKIEPRGGRIIAVDAHGEEHQLVA